MSNPDAALVSIIVPTLNRPHELRVALASIVAQTYPHIEIVVVNDGGPSVAELVRESCRDRPFVLADHPATRGTSAARNTGHGLCHGAYIGYLDDDDYFLPRHVELLVRCLEENPAYVAAYSAANEVIAEQQGDRLVSRKLKYNEPFNRARFLIHNYVPILCLLYRAAILAQTSGFDESLEAMEDWDFNIRLALSGNFGHIPEVTAEYVIHKDAPHRNKWDENRFKVIRRIYDRYAQFANPEVRRIQRASLPPSLQWPEPPASQESGGGRL